jgi:hypothetical protein
MEGRSRNWSGLGHQDRHWYLPLDLPLVGGEEGCACDQLLPKDVALFACSDYHTHGQLAPSDLDLSRFAGDSLTRTMRSTSSQRSVEALADAERSMPRPPSLERIRAAVKTLRSKINFRSELKSTSAT